MAYHYRRSPRPGTRAGETRELGAVLWNARSMDDWPPLRPAGPEPGSADGPPWPDPFAGLLDLSQNEKKLAMIAALGLGAWWYVKKRRRRA